MDTLNSVPTKLEIVIMLQLVNSKDADILSLSRYLKL
jgi:hypothetical protein